MRKKRTYPDKIINLAEVSREMTGKRNYINSHRMQPDCRVAVDELHAAIQRWREKHLNK